MTTKIICAALLLVGIAVFVLGIQELFALRRTGDVVPTMLWAKLAGATLLNTIAGWLLIRQPDVHAKKRAENAARRAVEVKNRRVTAAADKLSQLQE